ncbi:hypothetical protein ACP70R_022766 [Stipagrostis hirtigluma subsp. patula]
MGEMPQDEDVLPGGQLINFIPPGVQGQGNPFFGWQQNAQNVNLDPQMDLHIQPEPGQQDNEQQDNEQLEEVAQNVNQDNMDGLVPQIPENPEPQHPQLSLSLSLDSNGSTASGEQQHLLPDLNEQIVDEIMEVVVALPVPEAEPVFIPQEVALEDLMEADDPEANMDLAVGNEESMQRQEVADRNMTAEPFPDRNPTTEHNMTSGSHASSSQLVDEHAVRNDDQTVDLNLTIGVVLHV